MLMFVQSIWFNVVPFFQVRRMVSGRVACPMSVERSCSRPSTTYWSAVSWTAALSALASGLLSHTKRRRRPSIKGMYCWHTINCQSKAHSLMVRSQVMAVVRSDEQELYYESCHTCLSITLSFSFHQKSSSRSLFVLFPLKLVFSEFHFAYVS